MEKLEVLYENLEKYKDFDESPENIELFLNTVDAIVMQKNPSCIPILLQYFDDESEYSWALEILLNNILYFFKNHNNELFFKNIKSFEKSAPQWLEETISVIFNDNNCVDMFRHNMHLADKDSLLKLFDVMEEESPHHHALITELRKELEGKI